MQAQVEDVGPCKKLLKIEIPPEKVNEELDKAYAQLNDTVPVPGFRRGHVPRWLMQSKFGKQINDETKETLIATSFDDVVAENKLEPIGEPKFDEEIEFKPGEPLSFGVTIEVRPDFDIDDYTGLQLKRASAEPTKGELKERVEMIRRQRAKLKEVTKGSPKADDVVSCHITLTEGDKTYRDIPDHHFVVGDHVLVGMTLDETVELVKGAKVGEAVEKKIKLPDEYPDEAQRGAEMTLALRLQKIQRPMLPELTEEWLKKIGFDSRNEFDEEVRDAVRRDKERAATDQLTEQMTEQLLKKVDFDLPEDVIGHMAESGLVRQSLSLRYQGVPAEEIEKQLDKLKAQSRERAEKQAKLYFILNKIGDKERIFVTEDAVSARIDAMAGNSDRSSEQIRRDLESSGRLAELRSSMREEAVRAFLLEKATIKEPKSSSKKAAKSSQ